MRFPIPIIAGLLMGVAAILPVSAYAAVDDPATAAAKATLPEFLDFLRLPNVASRSSAEIAKNADWLVAAFRRHGWDSRLLPDHDTPMVYAEIRSPKATKTVLFYAHMDGQPVRPAEWAQPDPFQPVLRTCLDTDACAVLPIEKLNGKAIDPEWRIFARSAGDDKAPIFMMIAAMDALRKAGKMPSVNVRFLIDSHEEGGPPTLKDVIAENLDAVKADAIVMMDGPMHESNKPTVIFGHRGGGGFRLTVYGPKAAAHSGHYGNVVPNPAQNLSRLIATFKDAEGRVVIPGYYDTIDPAFTAASEKAHVVDDEEALKKRFGIAGLDAVGKDYRDAMAHPSLNIIGMSSGTQGATNQSIIPDSAIAAFDIRTVPGVHFDHQLDLVKGAIEKAGFHLVAGAPTDADRARYPLLASVESRGGGDALFTNPDSAVGKWVRASLGSDAVVIPIMGGGVPSAPLVNGLKVDALILPLANFDDNQHGQNENLRVGNYLSGTKELMDLLTEKF